MTGASSTGNTPGQGPVWLGYVPLVVSAHVCSGSVLDVCVHADEGRVVVSIGGSNDATVQLFTPRAELVRLIEVASAGLAELDAQTAVLAETLTDRGPAGVESAA